MRAVVQRVCQARVAVDGQCIASIAHGLVVLLGVGPDDSAADAATLAEKLVHLRIFDNPAGRFDHSLRDVRGAVLLVSQFTLFADTRRGRRPSFSGAAAPDQALPLCETVAAELRARGVTVATGRFGAHMEVTLTNDGPVTLWLDTKAS